MIHAYSCVTVSTKELQAHNSAVSANSSDHTNYFLKTPLNTIKSKWVPKDTSHSESWRNHLMVNIMADWLRIWREGCVLEGRPMLKISNTWQWLWDFLLCSSWLLWYSSQWVEAISIFWRLSRKWEPLIETKMKNSSDLLDNHKVKWMCRWNTGGSKLGKTTASWA